MTPPRSLIRQFTQLAAVFAWITIVLRFYLAISTSLADGTGIGGGIVTFLSYFTVLTNILVALALTAGGLARSRPGPRQTALQIWRRPGVATAIAVYITIVAVIYHVLLSQLWDPQGLTKGVDIMLHSVMPVAYLAYWWFAIPKRQLQWRGAIVGLSYPVSYSVYTLLLGAVRNQYPYPFSNVNELGYARVFLNSMGMFALFAGVALLFIGIGRRQARWARPPRSV